MKTIFKVFLLLVVSSAASAQSKETYDLVTYAPPKGWKKEVKENTYTNYTIINKKKNSYCQIFVMLSVDSKGSIKQDFENEWQNLIVSQHSVTDSPQIMESTPENGWEMKGGVVNFNFNNGKSIAMLTTMSGYKRTASIVSLTNSQEYLPSIQAFMNSIEMKVPDTNAKATTENNAASSILGTWSMSGSGSQRYDDYKNPTAMNNYGYTKYQYTFNKDGTYSFNTKSFRMSFDKILLVKESGTYQVNDSNLTIIPQKSVIEAWSKKDGVDKWGKLLTTQDRKLERVTYRFTKYYFSGIQLWNLVLQGNKATERDGPFSSNTVFTNAWYYGPITANNPVIELPGVQQITAIAEVKGTVQSSNGSGFAFTTTNFDDGWVATVQTDWVQVEKGTTRILIHYPNKDADDYNPDLMGGLKHAWDVLVAPKYSSASSMEFKPIFSWESIEFAEADMVEKATGKTVYVVFFKKNSSGGRGKYLEFITPNKKSFEQEFGAYHQSTTGWEKMESMGGYNKFAVAASDLSGKWSNKFTGTTQYVNAVTGLDAGMTSHASVQNYLFGPGNDYKWDIAVASGVVGNLKFQNAKSNGKFSMSGNWKINFSDLEGKPKTYDAYFSCIKGLRILWIDDVAFAKVE